ncbi:hypothetical protein MHYP_G00333920 [Metynnis hypsauchen]
MREGKGGECGGGLLVTMVTSSSSPFSVAEGGRDKVPEEEVDGRIRRLSHIVQQVSSGAAGDLIICWKCRLVCEKLRIP